MKKILRRVFQALPAPVKSAYARARDSHCRVWTLCGQERSAGEPISVAFAGSDAAKSYLVKKFFKDGVREEALGRVRREQALTLALSRSPDAALFVWGIPPSQEETFRPDAFAVLPGWIRMDAAIDEASGIERSDKLRKIRNHTAREGQTREVTTDPAQFEEFYRGVYLPYIASRHADAASPLPLEAALKKFVEAGRELIWVKKDGRMLGGCVIGYEEGEALFWLVGHAADVSAEADRRLGNSIYYHLLMRAKEKGCLRLNMGFCRPFLTDGILEYKRQFGAHPAPRRMPDGGLLALKILKETPGLKDLLKNEPFIAIAPDGRYGVSAFIDDADGGVEKAIERYYDRYCSKGGLDLRVYSLSPRIKLEREIRAPLG